MLSVWVASVFKLSVSVPSVSVLGVSVLSVSVLCVSVLSVSEGSRVPSPLCKILEKVVGYRVKVRMPRTDERTY